MNNGDKHHKGKTTTKNKNMNEHRSKYIVAQPDNPDYYAKILVWIFYDFSDAAFMNTAQLYKQFYGFGLDQDNIIIRTLKWKNIDELVNTIKKASPQFVNTIIHYVGHGDGRGNTRWPLVKCEGDGIKLDEIVKDIPFPNKQLIFDCCNFIPDHVSRQQRMAAPGLNLLFSLEGFNIITSSRKGTYSYYVREHFTLFYYAFENVFSGQYQNMADALASLNLMMTKLYKQLQIKFQQQLSIIDSTIPFEGKVLDLLEIPVVLQGSNESNERSENNSNSGSPKIPTQYPANTLIITKQTE